MILDFKKSDFKNSFIEKAIEVLLDERCSEKVLEKNRKHYKQQKPFFWCNANHFFYSYKEKTK